MNKLKRSFKNPVFILAMLCLSGTLYGFNNCGAGFDAISVDEDFNLEVGSVQASRVVNSGSFRGVENAFASRTDTRPNVASDITFHWDNPPGRDLRGIRITVTSARGNGNVGVNPDNDNFFVTSDFLNDNPASRASTQIDLPPGSTSLEVPDAGFQALAAYINYVDTNGNTSDVVQINDPLQTYATNTNPDFKLYGRPLTRPFSFLPRGSVSPAALYYFTTLSFCEFRAEDVEQYRQAAEQAGQLSSGNTFSPRAAGGRRVNLNRRGRENAFAACDRVPLPSGGSSLPVAAPSPSPAPVAAPAPVQAQQDVRNISPGFYTNPENRGNIIYILQGSAGTFFCSSFEDGSLITNVDGLGTLNSLEGIREFGECPANFRNTSSVETAPPPSSNNSSSSNNFENGQYVRLGFNGAVLQFQNGNVCRKVRNIRGVSEISNDRYSSLVSISGRSENAIPPCSD